MGQGKVCKKCGEWKEFEYFPKRKGSKDGYRNECKDCIKEYNKKYRSENADEIKAKKQEYYEENKDIISEHKKEYYQKNSDHIKESSLKYYNENKESYKKNYEKNKEFKNQCSREYYQNNKDYFKEYHRAYRQTDKGRNVAHRKRLKRRSYQYHKNFTDFEKTELLNRDNYTCQCCGVKVHDRSTGDWNTPDKAHIDHIIPISKGGTSEPSNLQVLCRTCNLSKSNKITDEGKEMNTWYEYYAKQH